MLKSEIFLADLGATSGSEQAGDRPVIIFQNDTISRYSRTTVIIPLTTNLRRAQIPGCVLLKKGEGGLLQDSVALCFQIRVLDNARLKQKIGILSPAYTKKIEEALKFTLDIN